MTADRIEVFSYENGDLISEAFIEWLWWADWLKVSNTGLAVGPLSGESIRVGLPSYRVQEDMTAPVAFLNLPPMHRDIVKDQYENNQLIEILTDAKATHYTGNTQQESSTMTSNRDWSLSTGFDMSVGGSGHSVTTSLENTYGEDFSKTEGKINSTQFEDTVTADL